ncbi:hypothetical protein HD554DRAFT_2329070 [Boletus coccyginus]|nr:hypothetical protein HD554DRAFT_2329070 [Boletus coccyginus]
MYPTKILVSSGPQTDAASNLVLETIRLYKTNWAGITGDVQTDVTTTKRLTALGWPDIVGPPSTVQSNSLPSVERRVISQADWSPDWYSTGLGTCVQAWPARPGICVAGDTPQSDSRDHELEGDGRVAEIDFIVLHESALNSTRANPQPPKELRDEIGRGLENGPSVFSGVTDIDEKILTSRGHDREENRYDTRELLTMMGLEFLLVKGVDSRSLSRAPPLSVHHGGYKPLERSGTGRAMMVDQSSLHSSSTHIVSASGGYGQVQGRYLAKYPRQILERHISLPVDDMGAYQGRSVEWRERRDETTRGPLLGVKGQTPLPNLGSWWGFKDRTDSDTIMTLTSNSNSQPGCVQVTGRPGQLVTNWEGKYHKSYTGEGTVHGEDCKEVKIMLEAIGEGKQLQGNPVVKKIGRIDLIGESQTLGPIKAWEPKTFTSSLRLILNQKGGYRVTPPANQLRTSQRPTSSGCRLPHARGTSGTKQHMLHGLPALSPLNLHHAHHSLTSTPRAPASSTQKQIHNGASWMMCDHFEVGDNKCVYRNDSLTVTKLIASSKGMAAQVLALPSKRGAYPKARGKLRDKGIMRNSDIPTASLRRDGTYTNTSSRADVDHHWWAYHAGPALLGLVKDDSHVDSPSWIAIKLQASRLSANDWSCQVKQPRHSVKKARISIIRKSHKACIDSDERPEVQPEEFRSVICGTLHCSGSVSKTCTRAWSHGPTAFEGWAWTCRPDHVKSQGYFSSQREIESSKSRTVSPIATAECHFETMTQEPASNTDATTEC